MLRENDPAKPSFAAVVASSGLLTEELRSAARAAPVAAAALALGGESEFFDTAISYLARKASRAKPLYEGPAACLDPFVSPLFRDHLEQTIQSSDNKADVLREVAAALDNSLSTVKKQEGVEFLDRFVPRASHAPADCACVSPVLLRRSPVYYPESLKRFGKQAAVTVTLHVDHRGAVRNVYLASPLPNSEFVGAAYAAVRRWKFLPGFCRGSFVDSSYRVTLRFELRRSLEQDGMPRLEPLGRQPTRRRD